MATKTLKSSWKATLETIPTKSELSLHSLWDLLYTDNGSLRATDKSGLSLKHNIICYNSLIYRGGGSVYTDQATVTVGTNNYSATELYNVFGIDASIAKYDDRVKNKIIELENCKLTQNQIPQLILDTDLASFNDGISVFQNDTMILHDKKSVLEPTTDELFVQNGLYVSEGNEFNSDYIPTGRYVPPYVDRILSTDTTLEYPIYLISEDSGFRGTLSTTPEYSAFNKIIFNYNNTWTAGLVLKALQNQITYTRTSKTGFFKSNVDGFWINQDGSGFNITGPSNSAALIEFVFHTLPSIIDNNDYASVTSIISTSGNWRQLLDHIYIWVKAPVFGDYIMPDVFNQDLNQESDVKHKNLLLSNVSDYNRYDKDINGKESDVDTLPYIPIASPSVDLLTRKLAGLDETDSLSSLNDTKIERIIEKGDNDGSVIGGIAMASETRDGKSNIVQPGFWDPESKRDSSEYMLSSADGERNLRHLPTIVPSTGNLFMDGRILSPTIDELWIYLKELTSGRKSDVFLDGKNATQYRYETVSEEDTSIPIGTDQKQKRQNDEDTRLNSVPETEYTLDYKGTGKQIFGDVISLKTGLSEDKLNQTISVTKVVNSNDAIAYTLFNAIKKLSEDITTFDYSDEKERSIYNFTAWSTTDSGRSNNDKIDDGALITAAEAELWAPRRVPYSLRELEAFVKGNKFNIISLARFIKENFGVTGRLGIITSENNYKVVNKDGKFVKFISTEDLDEDGNYSELKSGEKLEINTADNKQAGSLYQFHRNYNFNVAKPNTWFNQFGEGTPESGTGAEFDGTPFQEATDDTYGDADAINRDQNKYSSSDVYMAADGTWRYIFDHVRVPILHVKY